MRDLNLVLTTHVRGGETAWKKGPILLFVGAMHGGKAKLLKIMPISSFYSHILQGLFCALTMCDLEPCIFGICILSGESGGLGFRCRCFPGYTGTICDERPKPCADNPCTRCERRMLRIPYKPLSERMLHEPFWLGLITVTVVLGIIGLIWCAKRHFPEKLEKLLAEEADRSRHGTRCERRMLRIPYKPLSERMLHEPFWLGLITVTVVLGIIGLIWCAKRHFPEKLEKLLAEEADRSRHVIKRAQFRLLNGSKSINKPIASIAN
ncbi:hypothetical protein J437_LFUL016263 [Ladona fulva]|uniref:EGF-like domain-containing protein n=1 Tax=Ladona fulva TaxID=123851 RepID=A0A8K0KNT7_LADFU|nr:hypothetical protein J437_LFUL016263 [Ladona fulva]